MFSSKAQQRLAQRHAVEIYNKENATYCLNKFIAQKLPLSAF